MTCSVSKNKKDMNEEAHIHIHDMLWEKTEWE